MGFQREVSGVEEMELAVGKVAPKCFRARGAEDFVVLAPGDQQRRLVGAEVLLERGVAVEVELVVPKQLQLNGVVVLAVKPELVELPGLGRDLLYSQPHLLLHRRPRRLIDTGPGTRRAPLSVSSPAPTIASLSLAPPCPQERNGPNGEAAD